MANENQLQKKLDSIEDSIWKQHVTTKDKIIHGMIIGGITLLATSLAIAIFPFAFVLSVAPVALGPAGLFFTPVILASLFIAGSALMNKIVKGSMHIAINRVKKRCSDEINMNVIEKLSNKLFKEMLIFTNASKLEIDSSIINGSVRNFENLLDLIKERYANLKVKPEDLGEAIKDLENSIIKTSKSGKDADGVAAYNGVLKIQAIAHGYCITKIVENKEPGKSNVQENNFNKPKEQERNNIADQEPKKKVVPREENIPQNTPKKQDPERDIGNNE